MSTNIAVRAVAILGAAAIAVPVIAQWEGLELIGYRDPHPAGYPTACYGNRSHAVIGKRYTPEQCLDLLMQDTVTHATELDRCIKREVPKEVRAAFTSFAFNVGVSAACGSTAMRKLNAGDFRGACAELSRWTYAGGRQLPGLVKRRKAERALCERGLS